MYGGIGHIFYNTCTDVLLSCAHELLSHAHELLSRAYTIVNTCARIHLYVHMHERLRINLYVRMFYVLRAHLLLFHWSIYHMRTYCFRVRTYCFHMRTYWFHVRMYILENTCAFIHTCVRTYSLLHAHVNKYVKRAHVFENNAHVSSIHLFRVVGSLVVKHWSTIPAVVGSIPGRGTGNFRNASSVSHPTRDVLVWNPGNSRVYRCYTLST